MLRGRPGWCGKLNNRGEQSRIEQEEKEEEAGEKEALKLSPWRL